MPAWMADTRRQITDPSIRKFYQLMDPPKMTPDDPRLPEAADLLVEIAEEWSTHQQSDELNEPAFANLLDSFADQYAPVTDRLQELLNERGWTGWTHFERTSR